MIFNELQKMSPQNERVWSQSKVMLSCIEIYKDDVKDLLVQTNIEKHYMTNGIKFQATEIEVRDKEDV